MSGKKIISGLSAAINRAKDDDLTEAVSHIKRITPRDDMPSWLYDVADADEVQVILAAVASGDLVPRAEIERGLSDPTAVHYSMVKGTIAKPSIVQICHVYGGGMVPVEDVQGLVEAIRELIDGENWRQGRKFDPNSGNFDLSKQRAALTAWENRK